MNHITQKIMIMTTALLLSLSGKAQVAVVSNSDSKKYDVGEIPVEYSLTPSGAVSYTIPICPLCTTANSVKRH